MAFNLDVEWFMAGLIGKTRPPKFDWTDERIARLKEMWEAKDSAAVIGAEFGITRNAVLGKVNRLGLETHKAVPRKPKEPSRPRIRLYDKGPRKSPTVAKAIEQPVPQCAPVSFMELGDHSCHYPVTDDHPFMFCGADTHGEHSYCGHCYAICYTLPRGPLGRAAAEIRNRRMARMRKAAAG